MSVWATLILSTVLASKAKAYPTDASFGIATEVQLPAYRQAALARDLPSQDLSFATDDKLMVLGKTGLWQWGLTDRTLQHVKLTHEGEDTEVNMLRRLGSDGISWFAASNSALYQIAWNSGRVLRFALRGASPVLGFAGSGDDYWLLRSQLLMKIDRYGKALIPKIRLPGLQEDAPWLYQPPKKTLWYVQKKRLLKVDLATESPTAVVALTLKHQILDLQNAGEDEGLVAHTRYTVLRLSKEGKIKRAIPVEGSRKLLLMALSPTAHAYLFNDQLVEVYPAAEKEIRRYKLPLDSTEPPTLMKLNGSFLALLVSGRPHLFHLDMPLPTR